MSKLDDFQAMDTREVVARLCDPTAKLTMRERRFVAALISGELSRPPHRPRSPVVHDRRVLITMEAARLEAGGNTIKQAIGKIADRRRMTDASVKSDLAWMRKHYRGVVDWTRQYYQDITNQRRARMVAELNKSGGNYRDFIRHGRAKLKKS